MIVSTLKINYKIWTLNTLIDGFWSIYIFYLMFVSGHVIWLESPQKRDPVPGLPL